jgi:hypothetical protein
MSMKIFLSWSGTLSHKLAGSFHSWLPVVLPYARPWISSQDIAKGSRWLKELSSELEGTDCGIVFLLPGNIKEPWLNFEAGAISKSVENGHVFPFLFGVSKLDGPLSHFQITASSKGDIQKLILSINKLANDKALSTDALKRNFEICWPNLEASLHECGELLENDPDSEQMAAVTGEEPFFSHEHLDALHFLADAPQGRVFPKELAIRLNVHPERARLLLEELDKLGLAACVINLGSGPSWILSRKGRQKLVQKGLI